MTAEKQRLEQSRLKAADWKKWGPYLAERQWGTVREDYSANGDAWNFTTHDMARSKAYRWGEEGIGGICDDQQLLCISVALWNGRDPFLKERLFGLAGPEGNHGEDVKELYYYLDCTPTHSSMKMLYKYPHREFPYRRLLEENRQRTRMHPEFELIDTGIFDDDRYFDVFIEYAKLSPEDILGRVTIHNRGPAPATIHVLPQLWFRNTWAWNPNEHKPVMYALTKNAIQIEHHGLGRRRWFYAEGEFLFCDNETNARRLYNADSFDESFKDGINDYLVHNVRNACRKDSRGTKAAAYNVTEIPPQASVGFQFRLSDTLVEEPFEIHEEVFRARISEANEFYAGVQHDILDPDARNVQRQAFAGLLWSKQYYYYDVTQWLNGDPGLQLPPAQRKNGRNSAWLHMNNADIISMPDKWEYPWYAAWDLGFHCISLAMIDPDFAKNQLVLLTREWYMHPNGQFPAYEWSFDDANPPVHAWATWRVYKIDQKINATPGSGLAGKGDLDFLERVFHKLLLNFTWWVNRKDEEGNNIFQGGFLGLDNIGVFDRSSQLPTGGHIEQADGTSWMAMYSLNMMRIALELSLEKPVYQDMATKFLEHFLYIAAATTDIGHSGMGLWDEEDEFFYDVLHMPHGAHTPLKVRSMVGLIPLFAVETLEPELLYKLPDFKRRLEWFFNYRPDLAHLVSRWYEPGIGERRLLSLLRGHRMKCLLRRMLDETEFLSDYGVRALSRYHELRPYVFHTDGEAFTVNYQPAESETGLFGGNSNWRGPVWLPVNFLIIESLQKFHHYYGDDFKIEYPTSSGNFVTMNDVANELAKRLTRLFLRNEHGVRPAMGKNKKMQTDPHFKDYLLFHEYFHGDTGVGLGASHQTGWTGLIAKLLQPRHEATLV